MCVVIPCFQAGDAVQSERTRGYELEKERQNCSRHEGVIATFIIATFKKDLVSLFSPFALNAARIKATRHKELRCLSTIKVDLLEKVKGDRQEKASTELEERFHLNSQQ